MEILLDLVLNGYIKLKGAMLIASYILHNYSLSSTRASAFINNLIHMAENYNEPLITENNKTYEKRFKKAVRLYIILLKLMDVYNYTPLTYGQYVILKLECAISMDLICDYMMGKNKFAYKVYKQLMKLNADTLTRQKLKIMYLVGENLYAPGGQGYLEARDEYTKISTTCGL
jgi:hypothetical protein